MSETEDVSRKKTMCPYYSRWKAMMWRCYNSTYQKQHPTYNDCTVDLRWHEFSNFKQWMERQNWKGMQLDKDLLIHGNKIYSPEACLFVPAYVNTLLCNQLANRGKYPQGVSLSAKTMKFRAEVKINGKCKYLGCYETAREAEIVYWREKLTNVVEIALKQEDERLKMSLLRWAAKKRVDLCTHNV